MKAPVITEKFTVKSLNPKRKILELALAKDDESEVLGVVRDNIDLVINSIHPNDVVFCKGKLKTSKSKEYLEIAMIRKPSDDSDELEEQAAATVPESRTRLEESAERFDALIAKVQDEDYRSLLEAIFTDDIREMFFVCPGAKGNHHAYRSGLLEHTIEVTETALMLGDFYHHFVEVDLLITAALLHDIGKLKSYDYYDSEASTELQNITKTDWEALLGHLPMTVIFVSKVIPSDFNPDKAMKLYHMLLSHHGRIEYGSPIVHKMKEAVILHMADNLSFMINHINELSYDSNGWSQLDKFLNIQWFRRSE